MILEAQASGLPVVAVAEGGPASLIEHGETGLLAPADAEALAEALLSVSVRGRSCASGSARRRWTRCAGGPGTPRSSGSPPATAGARSRSSSSSAIGSGPARRRSRSFPRVAITDAVIPVAGWVRACCRRPARSRRRCCRWSTNRSSSTWSRSSCAPGSRACCSSPDGASARSRITSTPIPSSTSDPLIDPRTGLQIFYTRQARPAGLGDAIRYGAGVCSATARSSWRWATRSSITPAGSRAGDRCPADRGVSSATPGAGARGRGGSATRPSALRDRDRLAGRGPRSFERRATWSRNRTPMPSRADGDHGPLRARARRVRGPARDAARCLRRGPADRRARARPRRRRPRGRGAARRGERRHDIGSVESYCAAFLEHALVHPRFGPRAPGSCSRLARWHRRAAAGPRARGAGGQPLGRLRRRGARGDARRAARRGRGHAGVDARGEPAERAVSATVARVERELLAGRRASDRVVAHLDPARTGPRRVERDRDRHDPGAVSAARPLAAPRRTRRVGARRRDRGARDRRPGPRTGSPRPTEG